MTDDQGRYEYQAWPVPQQRLATAAAPPPAPTSEERAITAAAAAGPVVSSVSAAHGVLEQTNPRIANAVPGLGGTLNVLGAASSAASMRNAMRRQNASETVDGALGVGAGALGAAAAVAPVLVPASLVAGIGSTAYTTSRAVNDASGEALEYMVGGRQERAGRGLGAPNEVRTDNRSISDRLADVTQNPVGTDLALQLSPHLPVALGGERDMVQTGTIGRSADLAPSADETRATVLAEDRTLTEQRRQSDMARGGGHRGEDVRARHPELRDEESGEDFIQHTQRVQRELAAVNRRHRR